MTHIDPTLLQLASSGLWFTSGWLAKREFDRELTKLKNYIKFWSDESEKIQKIGSIGQKPGKREARLVSSAFFLPNAIENGKITIYGKENLSPVDSNDIEIVLSNHLGHADAWLHSHLFGKKPGRFLIEVDMVPPRQPAGIALTMAGAIPAPVDKNSLIGQGKAGVCMKKALCADSENGQGAFADLFVQGQIYPFDKPICTAQLKPGMYDIALGVAKTTGRPVKLTAVLIHYKLDIRKVNPLVAVFKRHANKVLKPHFNGITPFWVSKYATTVVILEPFIVMPSEPSPNDLPRTLPRNKDEAIRIIGDAMAEGYQGAKMF